MYGGLESIKDLSKNIKGLLSDLSKNINDETLDDRQLIEVLREFLEDKRYFVVVDDVWDISVWKMIRCALPDNDVGYTIITTTRISHVAEQVGGDYNMKPLSLNNSRKLLYRRIFGNGNKGNNEAEEICHAELAEVSDRILKKCAGVPLAIITMASLLACKARNKMEWYEVYNSVGTGLENNLDVENMRKILSFSYYELPCHLRACLLYLSMFPEDYEIDRDRLIRMWVGEGFIQYEKAGKSLFELGESYFNELINRSMIQPVYDDGDIMIQGCRVHDMMLDLIRSLSSEENFVTVLSNMGGTSPSNTIRRLSLQIGQEKNHVMVQATFSMKHARSLVVFPAIASIVLPLACCRVLRVLDLDACDLSRANGSFKCLGNIHHLRYLGLRETGISQLPEEIGNLQFLQTLDVRGNAYLRLPSSVVQLRKLMCLYIDSWSKSAQDRIGNLTCLEQLSWLCIDDSTRNIIEQLGQLTELRQLSIKLDEWNDKLLECLCKLQKMQELVIECFGQCSIDGDAWVAPRHLRVLYIPNRCWFSTLPAWVNPSLLPDLTKLSITVRELHQVDLEILGRLPALRFLSLKVDNKNLSIIRGFVVGAGAFPCLVSCYFYQFVWPVVFQQGAMRRLRKFEFQQFYLRETRGIACNDGSLELCLGNLPSLQDVQVVL
ncbi:hypothetical protein SETIT_8G195500v2 [Setaria italica]|uniref:Uncharacterized protein n=1 Tax=Setaria italica TaxID=4555 RepID=A0A368S9I2_SETIT|nr:hypothetical protein SETIT_8G195500v2 [Setaria italica]